MDANAMLRHLTKESEQRFMGWAQERDQLTLSILESSIPEKVQAYKQFEKRVLKEARTALEKQEMRRRITEDLLMATMAGPWRGFSPYLRRMERLGYSSMDCRLLVCAWSAQASKGSPAGVRKTAALIADFERKMRGKKLHPGLQQQIDTVLARARSLASLSPSKSEAGATKRHKRTKARSRHQR
jgi:hypothetical protein